MSIDANNIPEWKKAYYTHIKSPQWKAIRKAKLNSLPKQCQRCGRYTKRLDVHHLTYERLGNERLEDLLVVCGDCHAIEDKIRAAKGQQKAQRALSSAIYESGRDTYMTKKYGEDWCLHRSESSEYDEWLERKRDEW